jgi:MFS family permease
MDEVISYTRANLPSAEVVNKLAASSVLGTVLASGLRALIGEPRITEQALRGSFESAGRAAIHKLERYLNTLGTIAAAAPLMGLLGTVVGMIEIFGSQSPTTAAAPEQLAHGISVALYNTAFGLIVAIPYAVAAPAMLLHGWHSDKSGERRWHIALAAFLAGAGLALSQWTGAGPAFAIGMFTLAAMGIMSFFPPFWPLPARLLSQQTAAASFGFINLGTLGGFIGPYVVGFLTDRTGSYAAGIFFMVATAALAGVVVLAVGRRAK